MSQMPASYVMGHDDRERRRLSLQASILNPLSDQLLRRAGLSSGLRVLDIGCGVGELSMVAARLVGRRGHVTGIDIDTGALAIAEARAREQGFDHIDFAHSDIETSIGAPAPWICRTTRSCTALRAPAPLRGKGYGAVVHTTMCCATASNRNRNAVAAPGNATGPRSRPTRSASSRWRQPVRDAWRFQPRREPVHVQHVRVEQHELEGSMLVTRPHS